MNCAHAGKLIDAWQDDELDAATARDVEQHLAGCHDCGGIAQQRVRLRGLIRADAPRFAAPATLRASVAEDFESMMTPASRKPLPAPARGRRRNHWRNQWRNLSTPLRRYAAVAAIALASGFAGHWLAQPTPGPAMDAHLIASHVASLAPGGHLVDVTSSERHVVKPWFQGKVQFAPTVRDLSAHGFVLVGGRIERIGDRPAVAIVYRLRAHYVSLYMWFDDQPAHRQLRQVRGFSRATWSDAGLRHEAISDMNPADIERFVALVHDGS